MTQLDEIEARIKGFGEADFPTLSYLVKVARAAERLVAMVKGARNTDDDGEPWQELYRALAGEAQSQGVEE